MACARSGGADVRPHRLRSVGARIGLRPRLPGLAAVRGRAHPGDRGRDGHRVRASRLRRRDDAARCRLRAVRVPRPSRRPAERPPACRRAGGNPCAGGAGGRHGAHRAARHGAAGALGLFDVDAGTAHGRRGPSARRAPNPAAGRSAMAGAGRRLGVRLLAGGAIVGAGQSAGCPVCRCATRAAARRPQACI